MPLTHITLTGAGRATPLASLIELSQIYPLVEWGLLYSPGRAGAEPRYPSYQWLSDSARTLLEAGCRVSLHLCGDAVPEFADPLPTLTRTLASCFDRVQINIAPKHIAAIDWNLLAEQIVRFKRPVITQQNAGTEALNKAIIAANHCVLFDASLGRGIEATSWPSYWDSKAACGYAGGLSPENITDQMPKIAAAAGGHPFWIDCEGRIRDERDELSLERCELMLKRAYAITDPARRVRRYPPSQP